MADELVDVVDENNNIISKELKSVAHKDGKRHRVSAVLLQREDGKYLIPTASKLKVEAGKLYHSAAGHVASGESYHESAIRELSEEAGVQIDDLEFLGSFWFEKTYSTRIEKERFEVYKAKYIPEMGKIKLNDEQVDEKWLSKDELKSIYIQQPDTVSDPLKNTLKFILKL